MPQSEYINALLEDLDGDLAQFNVPQINTIYFGGGTPSVFEPEQIARFLSAVAERITLAKDVEITLEANPGTVDSDRFVGYRQAGVNRLSIGVQSFNPDFLNTLGRIHDRQAAIAAAQAAQTAGFSRYNLDLMFALPGQTEQQALDDIDQALALNVQHLSCYQLTIEPNTPFAASPPVLPDNDAGASMHDSILKRLEAAGFMRYEVSAFATPSHACQHNINYWQFGDYLGIGAGAHGKMTQGESVIRTARVRHPKRYLGARNREQRLSHERRVAAEQVPFEFVLNALRLTDGFSRSLFESRTALPFETIAPIVEANRVQGLVTVEAVEDDIVIRTTPRGYQMLDDVVAAFLPDQNTTSGATHAVD